MDAIYYQGVWRMDWGLGNPNTTAALIALLMLAVWTLPLIRRWLFWVALPLCTALGLCLMHTMSRGGVVAAVAGFVVLLVHRGLLVNRRGRGEHGEDSVTHYKAHETRQSNAQRPQRSLRLIMSIKALAVVAAVMVVFVGAVTFKTSARFAKSHNDRSVSNRLVIWKQTPRMMVDAPWGWGIGNASTAYMSWYQPLEKSERYRTLVNSHLVWLVEFGWPMRVLYVFGWVAVFVLCMKPQRARRTRRGEEKEDDVSASIQTSAPSVSSAVIHVHPFFGVVCGMWVAFFVAAIFSSVAEDPLLWVLPVLGLIGVLIVRFKQRLWPSRLAWASGKAVAVLALGILTVCGYATEPPVAGGLTTLRNGAVCVGARPPKTWVVVDTSVEGKAPIYETYRVYRASQTHPPIGIAPSPAALPDDLTGCTLAVLGVIGDWDTLQVRAKTCESLLLIAPDIFPEELDLPKGIPVRVVFGEFSNRPSAGAWQGTGQAQMIEGVGDFFQDWTGIVFGTLE